MATERMLPIYETNSIMNEELHKRKCETTEHHENNQNASYCERPLLR